MTVEPIHRTEKDSIVHEHFDDEILRDERMAELVKEGYMVIPSFAHWYVAAPYTLRYVLRRGAERDARPNTHT